MINLIANYIENMNIYDLKTFLENNNIYLSNEELEYTYHFIINNWKNFINNPNSFVFSNYKDKYSEENYTKLNDLINTYKNKYNI